MAHSFQEFSNELEEKSFEKGIEIAMMLNQGVGEEEVAAKTDLDVSRVIAIKEMLSQEQTNTQKKEEVTVELKDSSERSKHDELFKLLLESFFIEFVELFYPNFAGMINTGHLVFLPQEIIVDIIDKKKHIVDILVETHLNDEEGIVIIHVENKSQQVAGYNEKMYRYYNRIYEKYRRKIVPIIIYAHDSKTKEAESFRISFSFLDVVSFNFLVVQLKRENWRDYIDKNNPVAAALISKMNYTEQEKIDLKIAFARMMTTMQIDMAKKTLLTAFFETYVQLNEVQEKEYLRRLPEELNIEEVESLVQITTSYHEAGRVEGRVEEARDSIHDNLSDLADYSMHREGIEAELSKIKDLAILRELRKISHKAVSAGEFMNNFRKV